MPRCFTHDTGRPGFASDKEERQQPLEQQTLCYATVSGAAPTVRWSVWHQSDTAEAKRHMAALMGRGPQDCVHSSPSAASALLTMRALGYNKMLNKSGALRSCVSGPPGLKGQAESMYDAKNPNKWSDEVAEKIRNPECRQEWVEILETTGLDRECVNRIIEQKLWPPIPSHVKLTVALMPAPGKSCADVFLAIASGNQLQAYRALDLVIPIIAENKSPLCPEVATWLLEIVEEKRSKRSVEIFARFCCYDFEGLPRGAIYFLMCKEAGALPALPTHLSKWDAKIIIRSEEDRRVFEYCFKVSELHSSLDRLKTELETAKTELENVKTCSRVRTIHNLREERLATKVKAAAVELEAAAALFGRVSGQKSKADDTESMYKYDLGIWSDPGQWSEKVEKRISAEAHDFDKFADFWISTGLDVFYVYTDIMEKLNDPGFMLPVALYVRLTVVLMQASGKSCADVFRAIESGNQLRAKHALALVLEIIDKNESPLFPEVATWLLEIIEGKRSAEIFERCCQYVCQGLPCGAIYFLMCKAAGTKELPALPTHLPTWDVKINIESEKDQRVFDCYFKVIKKRSKLDINEKQLVTINARIGVMQKIPQNELNESQCVQTPGIREFSTFKSQISDLLRQQARWKAWVREAAEELKTAELEAAA